MKIALISSPLDSQEKESISLFRVIHDASKMRLYWNRLFRKILRPLYFLDFEDYPLNLVQLATLLKEKHEVRIFNFLRKDLTCELFEFRPDVAGFNCSGGGNLVWIDKFSRKIKSELGSIILLGGSHPTLTPAESLKTTAADYVFKGESDFTIKQTMDFISGKRPSLPEDGLCYRKEGKIIEGPLAVIKDLSSLPLPDHSLLDLEKYKSINIEVSRGCGCNCSFCYISGYQPAYPWRMRNPEAIIDEIKSIKKRVKNEKRFYFVDANFGFNLKLTKELLKKIINEKLNISFWTGMGINIDDEALDLMKQAGCSFFFTGIESGSRKHLDKMSKINSQQYVEDFIKKLAQKGFSVTVSLVLMLPEETRKELAQTFDFCLRLSRIFKKHSESGEAKILFYPNIYRPVPATPDYHKLVKKGFVPPKTFREWGEFYNEISTGNFRRCNFTSDVTPLFLKKILLKFTLLNMATFFLPALKTFGINFAKRS
ncbi:MAG: radical SAM protein [Candidatus Omnitrophica bacterium]|nr:radical SAM protein [Candidatus Omnitrophota bacterium]MBD3269477.1 radical SAM protein [Candidatus Omnitrophota bacterium]